MNQYCISILELLGSLRKECEFLRDTATSKEEYAIAEGYGRCMNDVIRFARNEAKEAQTTISTNDKLKQLANTINKANEIIKALEKGE